MAEPIPRWYKQRGWRFGSMSLHVAASVGHVAICLIPLVSFLFWPGKLVAWVQIFPWVAFLWVLVVSLGYPTWAWIETKVFERWVRKLPERQRKVERESYKLHAGMAKNFWQAVMQMYTIASLIGIALKS